MLIVEQSSWNVQQVGTPSASSRFRGYRVQETQWRWRRDGMEKGISSADLCSVSPTCRARGNHFSILQRPGFLSNSLLFLLCVYLAPSVTRFPCCALLHCSLLPLHLLVANRDQISLEVTRDSFETHNEYTVLFSCRTQTFTSLQTWS